MVNGLDKFRDQFHNYPDQYILIGGAACDILMDEAGLSFRATKDLDIVLCVEALDAAFVRSFWQFVQTGKYQTQQSLTGKSRYYRFIKPENHEYPFMLELFARKPDILNLNAHTHLTPIPMDEEISSLSAILLDNTYYHFLHSGKMIINQIPIAGPAQLIPLKARAWLDLSARRNKGEPVDSKSIAKHKNDVFRLYQIIDPTTKIAAPRQIQADLRLFFSAINSDPVDLKNLGIKQNLTSILTELQTFYSL